MDVMDHQVRGGCLRFRTPGTLLTGKYWATSNQSFLRCLGFLSSSQVSLSRFCPVQASSNPNSWQLGVVSGRRFSLSLSELMASQLALGTSSMTKHTMRWERLAVQPDCEKPQKKISKVNLHTDADAGNHLQNLASRSVPSTLLLLVLLLIVSKFP